LSLLASFLCGRTEAVGIISDARLKSKLTADNRCFLKQYRSNLPA